MSELEYYNVDQIVSYEGDTPAASLAPGALVRHILNTDTSRGMLIAVHDEFATVLWSVRPNVIRYNPLSVDEDVWIPVRNHNGAPVAPKSPQQEKEDVDWITKQFRRMIMRK